MNQVHDTMSRVASPPHLRLVPLREPDADPEPVSPELALIDNALRDRLLDDLYEPGTFWRHEHLIDQASGGVGVSPPPSPIVHPSGGYAIERRLAFVHRMLASTLSLPSVIAVAVAFATVGFAAGHIGHRARIAAPAPSTTGAPPPTVDAASRPTPKTASPRNTHTPLAPRHAATSAEGPGRTFAWVASTGVRSYEVQFFRGAKRVLARRVNVPRIILPSRWTYAGRNETLRPGTYRWYVWPLRGNPASRARKPVVQASFKIAQPG